MKSLRNRLRQAVLASIPAVAAACTNGRTGSAGTAGGAGSGGVGSAATTTGGTSGTTTPGGGTTSGGTTGSLTSQNLCAQCAEEGLTCNSFSTACVSYCSLCMCSSVSAVVGPTDGGYPDGGLPLPLCKAACPDPRYLTSDSGPPLLDSAWDVIACGLGDGGCPPLIDGGSAGTSCVICTVEDCSGIGRVPEGLCVPAQRAGSDVAGWLARAAHLEAASVVAFERMAGELADFGAPRELIDRARAAAREEARHAELMGRQATRFGGQVPKVEVLPRRARTLEELALENVREGCVGETFGAAICAWQAIHAPDPEVRSAMEQIADDEAGHAELSWDVAWWAAERLEPEARHRLAGALAQARHRLASRQVPSDQLQEDLGLPGAAASLALLGQLDGLIWGPSALMQS